MEPGTQTNYKTVKEENAEVSKRKGEKWGYKSKFQNTRRNPMLWNKIKIVNWLKQKFTPQGIIFIYEIGKVLKNFKDINESTTLIKRIKK